jgi:hypothetical protein
MRRELQTIGPKVLNNYIFLRKIAKSKSEKRRIGLLKNASKEQLLTLVEVASNILSSNFSLTKRQKEKLLPHAHYVRKLSRSRSEVGARRIVQRGNGAVLASLLIPIVAEAARFLLLKKGIIKDG